MTGELSILVGCGLLQVRLHIGTQCFLVHFVKHRFHINLGCNTFHCISFLFKAISYLYQKVMFFFHQPHPRRGVRGDTFGSVCLSVCLSICLSRCVTQKTIEPSSLQIAVYGKNFCTSAKNAFFLILRNIVRLVTSFLLPGTVHLHILCCIQMHRL